MERRGTRNAPRRSIAKGKSRRNKKRFDFRRLILPFVVLVVSAGVGYGVTQLLTTPSLMVRHVRVDGAKLIPDSAIASDASSLLGKSILTMSGNPVIARILKHPEVKEVTLHRKLPRTVLVKLTERTPFVNVTNGSGFWLVDRSGLPYHKVGVPVKSVTTVQLPPDNQVVAGRKLAGRGLTSAMSCLEACPALARRVTKISVDRAGNLCLNIGSDFYVKLGQPVEIPQKMQKLAELIAAQPDIGRKVEYVNASCYQALAVKPRQSADIKPADENM